MNSLENKCIRTIIQSIFHNNGDNLNYITSVIPSHLATCIEEAWEKAKKQKDQKVLGIDLEVVFLKRNIYKWNIFDYLIYVTKRGRRRKSSQ